VLFFVAFVLSAEIDFVFIYSGYAVENTFVGKTTSEEISSLVDGKDGVKFSYKSLAGSPSYLTWRLSLNGTDTYNAIGNATFGATHTSQPHVLYYDSPILGYIDEGLNYKHFCGVFNITGGSGAFFGAKGKLTSNLILQTNNNTFTDYQAGRVFLP